MSPPADPYSGIAAPAPAPASSGADPYAGIAVADTGSAAPAPATNGLTLVQTSPKSFTTKDRSGRTIAFTVAGDATDDQIRQAAADAVGSKAYLRSAVMRGDVQPTDQSRLGGFVGGLLKPFDNLAEAADKYVPGLHTIDQAVSNFTGMPTADQAVAENDALRAGNARTGYQTLGNIAGVTLASRLPGGWASQGAQGGALLSDADHPLGVAEDSAKGVAGAFLGNKFFQGLGLLASGVKSRAGQMLYDAGVPQTLGQIAKGTQTVAGKYIGDAEDWLSKFPITGTLINAARDRGVLGYNTAVGNHILDTVGEKVPDNIKPGHDLVAYVGDRLSAKYQSLLPKLSATADADFANGVNDARSIVSTLPDNRQAQFQTIVNDALKNRMSATPTGSTLPVIPGTPGAPKLTLTGNMLQDAESKLNTLAKQYSKSTDVDQQRLGEAIGEVRDSLRDMVMRQNPDHADDLANLRKGWAQLAVAETAAGAPGNTTGVFTPKALASAARQADSSVRKRATARGQAPGQDFRDTAANILSNRTPSEGGDGRTLALLAAIEGVQHPYVVGGLGAAALPYTQLGQTVTNKLAFAPRPAVVQAAAIPLNQIAKYAPSLVAPLAVGAGK